MDPAAERASQPDEASGGAWRERRFAARVIRFTAVAGPAVVSCAAAFALGQSLPAAPSLPLGLVRFFGILAVSATVMAVTRVLTRRLLPLSTLLSLSLAFPDETPRRLRLALRAPSAKRLSAELARLDAGTVEHTGANAAATHIVTLVGAISAHHRHTRGHSERVRAYTDLLAKEMGLGRREREMLTWAALLHDLGKLTVPTRILDKPGQLDSEERRLLDKHPAASARMAEPLRDWMGEWWYGIGQHHEKWNGTGYPARLRGTDISLAGRIVALADAFETMTAARSYKRPVPIAEARAELVRCAGSHFDPQVVRAFLNVGLGRLRTVSGIAAWAPVPLVNALLPVRNFPVAAGGQATAAVAVTATMTLGVPAIVAATQPAPPATAAAPAPRSNGAALGSRLAGATTTAARSAGAPADPAPAPDPGGSPAATPGTEPDGAPASPSTTTPSGVATTAAPAASDPPVATTLQIASSDGTSGDGDGRRDPTTAPRSPSSTPAPPATPTSTATTAGHDTTTPTVATTAPPAPLSVVDDAFTVQPNAVRTVTPLANDGGYDRWTLRILSHSGDLLPVPVNGTVTFLVPADMAGGDRSFRYEVCTTVDRHACASATATIHIAS